MFGLGWSEIFIIVLIGLLVIGPDKLPEVARGLAKTIRGVQRLAAEVRYSINLDEMQDQGARRPTAPEPDPPPASKATPPGSPPQGTPAPESSGDPPPSA